MSLRAVVMFTPRGRLDSVIGVLQQFGWETSEATESELLERIERRDVDLVVIGAAAGFNRAGIALTRAIRARDARCLIVLFTESSSEEFAVDALRAGASDLLISTASQHEIAESLGRLPGCPDGPSPSEDRKPLAGGGRMIGASVSARGVRDSIRNAAATDSNVLITGETGTGKELVAELIHRNSARASRPMVCINCAAIPDALLESELFGYERGAFTGAVTAMPGKLEQAAGGSIFFDEIGDMSAYAQAKILRAIESREVYRLGGRHPIRLNVRVMAATNRDLDELAMKDAFRKDLYFRINVARVHMAPLRERQSDIPALIDHYVHEFNHTFHADVRGLEPETLDRLIAYDWPGNVRELRNVIESVFGSRPAARIVWLDLPDWLRRRLGERTVSPGEQERIISALAATNWNKSKAAEQLHWSRMTLYRKLAKYQIREV
ncbi:MAG TPA: sigma-54 dependent transcriptional regulator [Thermoanaerobaculia bacterium]|nr:sigma-54 dependent transcriptional regulator [Thermoanaerobaculia bacterium]